MTVEMVPATVGQRLLWMMGHYRGDARYGTFNCPVLCRLRGALDRSALVAAVDALVARHEALRTVFHGRGKNLAASVRPATALDPRWIDVSADPDPRARAEAEVAEELRTLIDVRDSPIRVTVWRLSDVEHLLCVNLHHMVTDAWSTGVLFRELRQLYASGGDPGVLPPAGWQYSDFARWQHEQLTGGGLDRQRAYWLRQLDGARLAVPPRRPAATDPPATSDLPTAPAATASTGVASVDVPEALTLRLRELARASRATLFTVLLAGYYAQLYRVTGQRDLTVASLFANRSRPQTHGTVGFLANMVMLRSRDAGVDPRTLLRTTHATAVGAFAHQEQPFQTLPPHLVSTGGLRADDVVFQVVTDPQHLARAGGIEFELIVPEAIGSRFSFELAVAPLGSGLRSVLFYRTDWFDPAWTQRFVEGYRGMLERFAARC